MIQILKVVLPIFLIIAVGFIIGKKRKVNVQPFINLIVYITGPALIFASIVFANCSHIQNKNEIEKPPRVEIDGENLVSAQVAFDLAFSSYLKACVDINHFHGKKKIFHQCARQAR